MATNKKRAMWTDMLGIMSARDSGPVWVVKPSQMREWSFELRRHDMSTPYDLYLTSKAKEDWIQMPGTIVKGAEQEPKSNILELKISEGVEERTLLVDTSRHIFKKEPFAKSIEALGDDERFALIGPLTRGVSKRAILSILGVAEDITENEDREREELNASKKKKATDIMKKKDSGEGSSRSTQQAGSRVLPKKKSTGEADIGRATEAAHDVTPLQSIPASSQETQTKKKGEKTCKGGGDADGGGRCTISRRLHY